MLMHAWEKMLSAQTLKDFRYLALQATQTEWCMKAPLLTARDQIGKNCQGRHVIPYGGADATSVKNGHDGERPTVAGDNR